MMRTLSSRIRTPDGTSFVEHRPDGGVPTRTVVLLHGIGGNARSCTDLAQVLAARGDVDLVDRLLGAITARRWGRVDLIGTSWGGVIATCLAHRRPGAVRSLVLADSTRGSATSTDKARAMRSRVPELERLGPEEFAARRASRLVSPHAEEEIALRVRRQMSRVRLPGYRMAADFMASTDTGPLLADITTPTLVLVGEDDVVTGVPESRLLADRIPGARLTVVPRAGHAAVTERPDEVARAVTDFWTALDG